MTAADTVASLAALAEASAKLARAKYPHLFDGRYDTAGRWGAAESAADFIAGEDSRVDDEAMAERRGGPAAKRQIRLSTLRAAGWRLVAVPRLGPARWRARPPSAPAELDWYMPRWLARTPEGSAHLARCFPNAGRAQVYASECYVADLQAKGEPA